MKILMACDTFYPVLFTGGEVHSFNVARSLVKLGHDVTVVAAKTAYNWEDIEKLEERQVVDGINIIRTKTPFRFGSMLNSLPTMVEMCKEVKKQICRGNADVVVANQYRPWISTELAARRKVPCVALCHDIYTEGADASWRKNQKLGGFAAWALEQMTLKLPYDHILAVSVSTRQKLLKYYPENKISVIYNGVDLEKIDSIEGRPKKSNQVIYLGHLLAYKNVLDAIKAVELARKSICDLELVICSTGGPQEYLVKEISKERKYVRYLGKVTETEKIRLLKESSLLLLPSSAEGFGLVLIEALSCQTPFVAYDIPAVREVRSLTKGGVLVPHRDYIAMAKMICYLLSNRALLEELASTGRREVEKKFTWAQVALKEIEVFERLIRTSGSEKNTTPTNQGP